MAATEPLSNHRRSKSRRPAACRYGVPVAQWAEEYLGLSRSGGYRQLESDDPPPVFTTPTGRKLVAVNSPAYRRWEERRMTVNLAAGDAPIPTDAASTQGRSDGKSA